MKQEWLLRSNARPNTQKLQMKAVYKEKTQHANLRGNPLYQATKR